MMAKAHQQAEGFDDTGYIFMVSDNFKSFYDRMRKAVPAMCLKIGAPRNTPYSGRRTFISSLVDANVNIKTIRNYVGHKDARTTLNNYTFDRNSKQERIAQLEAARLPFPFHIGCTEQPKQIGLNGLKSETMKNSLEH